MSGSQRQRTILFGCVVLSVGMNAFMIAPPSVGPLFQAEFGISDSAVGTLVSAAILGSIIVQLPGGYFLDRYDNRTVVGATVLLFVLVVFLTQVVRSFTTLLVLRVLGGLAAGLMFTTGANIIGEVYPTGEQDFATGLYLASSPLAFAFAHSTSPPLGTRFGPRVVFYAHAALAVAGLVFLVLGTDQQIKTAESPTLADFKTALGNKLVIIMGLSAFVLYAIYVFLNTWLPAYSIQTYDLSLGGAGLVTALVPLLGVFARPVGGWLSEYLGGRRRFVLVVGLLVGIGGTVCIPFTPTFLLFLAVVTLTAFAIQLGTGVYYVLARELAAPGTEGTSLTILTTIAFIGAFLAPIVGGWAIEQYSWTTTFAAFGVLGIFGIFALLPVSTPD